MFIWMSLSFLMGLLADRIGITTLMKIIPCLLLISSYSLLDHPDLTYKAVLFIQITISVMGVAFAAPCSAYLTSLFPTQQRYSGISLGYTLGSALLGGTAPLISAALLNWTGDRKAPAYYLMMCAVIAFFAVYSNKLQKRQFN